MRNSARDRLAVVGLVAAVAVVVAGVAISAPVGRVDHTTAQPFEVSDTSPEQVPARLAPVGSFADVSDAFTPKPLVVDGMLIVPQEHGVLGVDPETGETKWVYEREDVRLCSVSTSFSAVQAVFRGPAGCGEVTSLSAQTGQYKATRSAHNADEVAPVISNDQVGTVSPRWVELWRSDLVRTMAYGTDEAPQEPDMQPHPNCEITAALARQSNVAVSERCPEDPQTSHVRVMKAVPEDARKPELTVEIDLKGQGHVVAISATHTAVYLNEPAPRLYSFDEDGELVADREVEPAPNGGEVDGLPVRYQYIADLPHHMSWFDGARLYLFEPSELQVTAVFEDAIGTGAAFGDKLLYPTREGIAVADWSTGEVERTIPVDRGAVSGPVSLAVVGSIVVEQRPGELVALAAA
ncbi:hypothetical protein CAQU_02995 [Corynebacterium aquilae DSM 44791]|uniref:Pyrrolo-quinoline quinone repeat domain-containing protein n=1 Tax=Corynebacterium aquilae DSM 44791 TaxID=1431546 RepID=A0A1L7CEA3_9CORY|nr:hypothetical protein CAQU_02995 [Corynebacterium aquilae DSM 44791]